MPGCRKELGADRLSIGVSDLSRLDSRTVIVRHRRNQPKGFLRKLHTVYDPCDRGHGRVRNVSTVQMTRFCNRVWTSAGTFIQPVPRASSYRLADDASQVAGGRSFVVPRMFLRLLTRGGRPTDRS